MKASMPAVRRTAMRWPILLLALAAIAFARDQATATDQNLALNLGNVLGSEEFCGLAYDQSAIEAFIEKHVAADDRNFAADLTMTGGVKIENQDKSPSEKTAHCTQIRRVAKSFGFIR
jgi:hypothetical protein